jgi:hypothetical protein
MKKISSAHLLFLDPGSGMGKNQDPGSGINIPDPQHNCVSYALIKSILLFTTKSSYFDSTRCQYLELTEILAPEFLWIPVIRK